MYMGLDPTARYTGSPAESSPPSSGGPLTVTWRLGSRDGRLCGGTRHRLHMPDTEPSPGRVRRCTFPPRAADIASTPPLAARGPGSTVGYHAPPSRYLGSQGYQGYRGYFWPRNDGMDDTLRVLLSTRSDLVSEDILASSSERVKVEQAISIPLISAMLFVP